MKRQDQLGSKGNVGSSAQSLQPMSSEFSLSSLEKRFLLLAERGDVASVRKLLEDNKDKPDVLNINCVDPLDRSALIAAIENENADLIRMLLDYNIQVKDSLLHAIKEEYVEAVEMLLEWEEKIHVQGQPYSWEAVDRSSSTFTPDITPLILAAHMNNYEILKILLDRGATLPMPHDVRCGCDECISSSSQDSLRHSQARINAYRALSAPSLIALSSRDPLLTAFELSWELRRLAKMEAEFRAEYNEMRGICQTFVTSLMDQARTSNELEIMLNYNPSGDNWEPGERQTLERLKLAIKYKQKQFVAHPNVQQLLAAIWYDGLPGFRRKSMVGQLIEVGKLGAMFPVLSTIYMFAPYSEKGQFMRKPFVKFICHSSSYAFFLMLLALASQRLEYLLIEWFGPDWMQEILADWKRRERGALPGIVEFAVILYVFSLVWNEMCSLWSEGLLEYIGDLWNIVDFCTNCFYMTWIFLRATSWWLVKVDLWNGQNPYYPREAWDPFDPMLLSEGAFAAGMIFSFLKLVHIFSVNPHLGPLQISLGRMIIDILKFFFIYTLVLFAFGCGMNQLLWYYAELEMKKCYHLPDGTADFDNNEKACTIWRRFANLFETSQSLFWAGFGLVDLVSFELQGIKSFTRFWALLMFGSYSVINIIVLLNMLIAMMSNSYQIISERSDTEWKFARSHLWMSYFEEGGTLPPPFNLAPTPKWIRKTLGLSEPGKRSGSVKNKSRERALERHDAVMRLLVRRYVTAEQRKRDEFGITEDDVMEIRQDISTLRFELIDILRNNGMKTPQVDADSSGIAGKKGRVMERRLLKDFQIGMVEGIVKDAISNEKEPKDVFSKIARAIGRRTSGSQSQKKDWNAVVRRSTIARDPIGSTTEGALRRSRQSLRRYILENQGEALQSMDPERLLEYNPKLSLVSPAARVAYAKFKMSKIKQEYDIKEASGDADAVSQTGDAAKSPPAKGKSGTGSQPPSQPPSQPGSQAGSIVRPRPKSSLPGPGAVIGSLKKPDSVTVDIEPAPPTPPPSTSVEAPSPVTARAAPEATASAAPAAAADEEETPAGPAKDTLGKAASIKQDFRARTPIPEEDEDSKTPSQTRPPTPAQPADQKKPEKKEEKEDSPVRRGAGPPKSGGKSKVSGQILTGWL
ncbi:transient receptor potential protein [Frankliniella occidentalis]|uniref:Transient receptor potential protein n=1 Tax=Frankliniella occidentalis TaxID=133901 RepID=A0A6J1SIJ0_FRAOC|nr:transient receptor potential protein [Frankliniella occidentalis]